jgi:hypothetical protein
VVGAPGNEPALGAHWAADEAVDDRSLFQACVLAAARRVAAGPHPPQHGLAVVWAVYWELVQRGGADLQRAVRQGAVRMITLSHVWQYLADGDFTERFMQALADTTGDPATVASRTLDALLRLTAPDDGVARIVWPPPPA